MEKLFKVKNISRADFHLSLDFVKEGKHYDLKPNTVVNLTVEEMDYLTTQCQGAFVKGFLQVVEDEKTKNYDIPVAENVMSEKEIEDLMSLKLPQFKKAIAGITSLHLIKDIRKVADEHDKKETFMKAIDEKIAELAEGSILI